MDAPYVTGFAIFRRDAGDAAPAGPNVPSTDATSADTPINSHDIIDVP